jgi:hypothetical protein
VGHAVQQTPDGGYIIAGRTNSFGAGLQDAYLIKTDSLGDTLWTKTYGGADDDRGFSVQQTSDGGYIISGWTGYFGTGPEEAYLIKTDSLGDTLWTRAFGGINQDAGYGVQTTSDGGYIVCGYTDSGGSNFYDVYLVKTDALGDTLWTRVYGGNGFDGAWSVQQTLDGGYIVAGWESPFGAITNVYLMKTDSLGDSLWAMTFGGSNTETARSVQQTADEGYILAGWTESFGAGNFDVYLIKVGPDDPVAVEESNDEYRAGNIDFRLFQNYPNPFHKLTAISYELGAPAHTTLTIYDISGRLVEILVDKRQDPGVYQFQWKGKDQSSGVYFYKLTSNEFTATRKLILLK